jgi:hypothetical protein
MLAVLALIAGVTLLIFPVEQACQHQLIEHTDLTLLLRSCDEARATAMRQRLTIWLLLQHPLSGNESFVLLEENTAGSTHFIGSWKELPRGVHSVFSPPSSGLLPEALLKHLPPDLFSVSNHLSAVGWNGEGAIVLPPEISEFILSFVTTSNRAVDQILFLKNSGRAFLRK